METAKFGMTGPKSSSFDYEAKKAERLLKIEVKGTTSSGGDSFFMTKNEVDLHTQERGKTGIIIVSDIRHCHVSEFYSIMPPSARHLYDDISMA